VVRDLAADDEATVVFFDSGAESSTRSTTDRASLLAAIDDVELSTGTTRYGPALQLAQGILEDSDQPLLEVVLISDFQRVGVDSAGSILLPPGTVLTPVSVADDDPTPNISVAGASVQRDLFAERERATVTARLANRGHEPVEDLLVSLASLDRGEWPGHGDLRPVHARGLGDADLCAGRHGPVAAGRRVPLHRRAWRHRAGVDCR